MGFANGIADGMVENAARSAASAAHWARVDAHSARLQASNARVEADALAHENASLKHHLASGLAVADAAMDVLRGLGDVLDNLPPSQREALKVALRAATAPYVTAREARMRAEGANEGFLPTSVYRNSKVIGRLGF